MNFEGQTAEATGDRDAGQRELREWQALASCTGLEPVPKHELDGSRPGLLAALDFTQPFEVPEKLRPQLDKVAGFFDLPYRTARALMRTLDEPTSFSALPFPGITALSVRAGARLKAAGAQACVLRIEPGASIPQHRHRGHEHFLVLQGGVRQHDGTELHKGALLHLGPGSAHGLLGLAGDVCLGAVLRFGDIEWL